MASGTNKLRIAWICHFMNQTVKQKLAIDENENEFAPWISLGIEEFRKRSDIELHVIAPIYRIRYNKTFNEQNIHYHFIKTGIPLMKTVWPSYFRADLWSNFYLFNVQVRNTIRNIAPDLIDLQGAENAYYSSSVLDIKGYPIIVTIQGFVTMYDFKSRLGLEARQRMQVEKKIMQRMSYFGLEGDFADVYVKSNNPGAKVFRYHCSYTRTAVKNNVQKEYDIVFFGGISKMKGIEDLIQAVSKVKKKKRDVTLCIIGRGNRAYVKYIYELLNRIGLASNVVITGFIPTQQKMHEEVAKAKISVLPSYNDRMPGSIVESMLLGIPAIAYNVGGIPDLNKGGERIILVEKDNIGQLADEIYKLLLDPAKQKELSDEAVKYASAEFDNTNNVNNQVRAYHDVIEDFNRNHE